MSELKLRPPKESHDEPPHSKAPASEGGRYTSEEKNDPTPRTDLKLGHYKGQHRESGEGRSKSQASRATQEPRYNTDTWGTRYGKKSWRASQ
jgi:hypothetical protein